MPNFYLYQQFDDFRMLEKHSDPGIYIWPVCCFFSRTLKFHCDKDSDFVKILHSETLTFYATVMAFTEGGTRSSWAFYRQKYFVLEAKPHILKENITAIFFSIRHR